MNKIYLENDQVIEEKLDNKIKYDIFTNDTFGIASLTIEVTEDTNLELEYNFKEKTKMETIIIVNKDVNLHLFEKINGTNGKLRTRYQIKGNATVSKFNNIKKIKEYTIINLDEENSRFEYNLKTIAEKEESYDILTYHNESKTTSVINPNGVNIKEGKLKFNVSSFVPKGKIKCDASQNNKIINLTNNECIINPNLYIDEYDVVANHSAWIGSFNSDEIFYLQSRGINKEEAIKLLIKGFLTSKLEITEEELENIKNIIDEYWR